MVIWGNRVWVIGLLLVVSVALSGCSSASKDEERLEEDTPSPTIGQMIEKYQATLFVDASDYTFQRQEALLNEGRRIVFEAYLEDIWVRDNKTYLSFTDYSSPVVYILESKMPDDFLKTLTGINSDDPLGIRNFVVVAQINSTQKPILSVDGTIEDEGDHQYVDITNSSSETLIAYGELINLVSE